MRTLYEISVWLHIVAACIWVGGMLFLVLIVVPWLRSGGRRYATVILRETGGRFRTIGWISFAVFATTGAFNLRMRGIRLADLLDPAWLGSDIGRVVGIKIGLFVLIVAISAVHDFVIGPRATAALERDPRSPDALALRRRASILGRVNALAALAMIMLGVLIVRGIP